MSQVISQDATLDDIIFKNKNREFGAFVLRKTYPKVMKRSVLLGSALFVGALLLAAFWKQLTAAAENKTEVTAEVMKLDKPAPPKKVELPPPPPPPPPKEIPKVTTTKFLPPEIKHDEEVTKPEPPPEEVKGNTASETVKGETESYEPPVDPDAGKANVGGRVFVSFVVNTDGSVQDVQVLKGVGFGCDEEAIRVIKSMPRWNPGKQSGRAVRSRFTQPITFVLSE